MTFSERDGSCNFQYMFYMYVAGYQEFSVNEIVKLWQKELLVESISFELLI